MSLETIHTKAAQSLASLRDAPVRWTARMFRVDLALAREMQAWLYRSTSGPMPEHFRHGNAAACFALMSIAARKPVVFWGALIAIPALPLLLLLRWA
ncbi:conserved protein of unknown function (plasmid) [Cupriavidus taiwanensis]|uniref:Uncharacterized protein n=1 Tax=Cupriavidus taiwanensis TaxID=164546 RepID=A0A375IS46_9BURK|nr:hypothetical protein [Cupriavidus taiwanensis]SPK77397.1 conserved protein of unknown function [Cupriavidus taiwanensis]